MARYSDTTPYTEANPLSVSLLIQWDSGNKTAMDRGRRNPIWRGSSDQAASTTGSPHNACCTFDDQTRKIRHTKQRWQSIYVTVNMSGIQWGRFIRKSMTESYTSFAIYPLNTRSTMYVPRTSNCAVNNPRGATRRLGSIKSLAVMLHISFNLLVQRIREICKCTYTARGHYALHGAISLIGNKRTYNRVPHIRLCLGSAYAYQTLLTVIYVLAHRCMWVRMPTI